MATIPVLDPSRYWACPDCPARCITRRAGVHSPMHPCGGLRGLDVPYLEVDAQGVFLAGRVNRRVVERGDYVGAETGVAVDADGRVVMGVETERVDGTDVVVFAPTARATTG